MPITEAQFAERIRQKHTADYATMSALMPTDARGRPSVRVAGNRLVPLMPLGASAPPAGAPATAAAPAGLTTTTTTRNAVDHTLEQTPVKDQGDRPTCVAFALLAALEALVKRRQRVDTSLSEQYAHWLFMSSQGQSQCSAGISTVQAAVYLHQAGVCTRAYSPYQTEAQVMAACSAGPSAAARQHATFGLGTFTSLLRHGLGGSSIRNTDLLESLLAQDLDVVVGFEGIFGLTDQRTGALDVFLDSSGKPWPARAGHSMLAVGYTRDPTNPYFLFKNSWLVAGGSGYMKVSYDYLRQYATCGVIPHQVRTNMPINGHGIGGGNGTGQPG
jgi:hypothetical protein